MKKKTFYLTVVIISLLINCPARAQWIRNDLSVSDTVFSFAEKDSNLYISTYRGVYVSHDNGFHFTLKNSGLNMTVYQLAISKNNIFACTNYGVYKSDDNAEHWSYSSNGIGDQYISAIAVTKNKLYAAAYYGIYESTNNGADWTRINDRNTLGLVYSFLVSPNHVFAATGAGVFIYHENTKNWSLIESGPNNSYVGGLAINNSKIYAGSSKGIFVSDDEGKNWTMIIDTVSGIKSFVFDSTNFFYCSSRHIFRSSTNFKEWTDITDNINDKYISSIFLSGQNLLVSTYDWGSGIWSRPLSQVVTSIPSASETPKPFSLSQNYPNPFNPSTTIRYALPFESKVKIIIYDILGREIKELVNTVKGVGTHEVEFNANNLSSGIYFYRINAVSSDGNKEFTNVKKLILLK